MRQTASIISTYTADVSGVASALFELGGMTVIHDASGCNSTYNTHDEPRWYNHDSLVFISALSEMDAMMGSDDKLINDIIETARELHPKFIAIAGTPIPMMIGTDLNAIAKVVEDSTGIPSFGLNTNSMHTYISGISKAFLALAKRFVKTDSHRQQGTGKVNIIGLTPLDYSINGSDSSMRQWLQDSGMQVCSSWAMGSTLEEIENAGNADVSLVVSYDGLAAARYLYDTYQIPYVIGSPLGSSFSDMLVQALKEASTSGQCSVPYLHSGNDSSHIVLIGESVYCESLASSIAHEYGKPCRVICPVETEQKLLNAVDVIAEDEDDIIPGLSEDDIIIADPLYKPICPPGSRFYSLPSESFSGRIYRQDIPNLINRSIKKEDKNI